MGGRGSGRIFRWDKQMALEECRFVDVRDWKRRSLLKAGSDFSWTWSRDGTQTADIRVSVRWGLGAVVLPLPAKWRRVAGRR